MTRGELGNGKVHVLHAVLYTARISSSVARTSDPGSEVPSRPLIFSLSHACDLLITSFHFIIIIIIMCNTSRSHWRRERSKTYIVKNKLV